MLAVIFLPQLSKMTSYNRQYDVILETLYQCGRCTTIHFDLTTARGPGIH